MGRCREPTPRDPKQPSAPGHQGRQPRIRARWGAAPSPPCLVATTIPPGRETTAHTKRQTRTRTPLAPSQSGLLDRRAPTTTATLPNESGPSGFSQGRERRDDRDRIDQRGRSVTVPSGIPPSAIMPPISRTMTSREGRRTRILSPWRHRTPPRRAVGNAPIGLHRACLIAKRRENLAVSCLPARVRVCRAPTLPRRRARRPRRHTVVGLPVRAPRRSRAVLRVGELRFDHFLKSD